MAVSPDELVDRVQQLDPTTAQVVDEHVADNGEVLLHLLVADLRRFCVAGFRTDRAEIVRRCLDVMADCLVEGDDRVENAIAVSFVEDTGWWHPEMAPFMAVWPAPLREEAERQRTWSDRQTEQ